ncbi:MAG: Sec-independent protein translocase protein TatB [Pseudomonadota bacterium]
MFDIAFSEIFIIMVVALVVIGPERLPQVARTLGKFWGRMQRYVNQVKQDVNSSIQMEELREVERQVKAQADSLEHSLQKTGSDISLGLKQVENELSKPEPDPKAPVAPPASSNSQQNNP